MDPAAITRIPADAEETQVVRTTRIPADAEQTQVVRTTRIPADAEQTQVVRTTRIPTDAEQTQVVRTGTVGGGSADDRWSGRGETRYAGDDQSDLGQRTVPIFPPSVENSGSLTGHILAQGWADAPAQRRAGNTKVMIFLAIGLGIMVLIGLLVAAVAADAFRSIFNGALSS